MGQLNLPGVGGAEARAYPNQSNRANWWAEFEFGSGVGMAAILSTSRITSSNRELDRSSSHRLDYGYYLCLWYVDGLGLD